MRDIPVLFDFIANHYLCLHSKRNGCIMVKIVWRMHKICIRCAYFSFASTIRQEENERQYD